MRCVCQLILQFAPKFLKAVRWNFGGGGGGRNAGSRRTGLIGLSIHSLNFGIALITPDSFTFLLWQAVHVFVIVVGMVPYGPRWIFGCVDKELMLRGCIIRPHPTFGKRSHLILHTASMGNGNSILTMRTATAGGRRGGCIGGRGGGRIGVGRR